MWVWKHWYDPGILQVSDQFTQVIPMSMSMTPGDTTYSSLNGIQWVHKNYGTMEWNTPRQQSVATPSLMLPGCRTNPNKNTFTYIDYFQKGAPLRNEFD